MRIEMKRFLGILLSLVMVLGLVPGISMTANAQTTVDYQSFFVDGINGAQNFDVVEGGGGVDVTGDTTNTRGVTWNAQESCAVFDGEAYLVINNPLKNANASTGFTITMEAYISSDNNGSGTYINNRGNKASKNGWQRLFDLSDGSIQKYLYFNAGSAGHLRYAVATQSNSNQQGETPGGSYYDAWHTYSLVVKPGGDMALYVDGTQISSMSSNNTIEEALNLLSDFNTCYIGSSVYETTKAASDGFFIGKIRGFSTFNATDVFKLTFNSNGGAEEIKSVATPIIPDDLPRPTKENYAFEGWYMDSELTQQATSGTKLTKDTTLYAKWTPIYTVTYKVVGGTWLDGSTTDKTETVQSGSNPDDVPTGMIASPGYTGGSWNTNPANAIITEATKFTYTFTAKENQVAPTELTATKASSSTAADGKIGGVTSAMEYQKDGDTAWTAVGSNQTEITGLTAGTYKVRYKETADKNASDATSVVVGVKVAPTVTAPTAKALTYNGQAQELVTAGKTDGGTMQYALGTATEATQPYTTSIPTATDAGTYYVWYRVKGDLNHYDSEPRCVTVNIANALYTVTSVENWEHTIDYPNDIIITVKRNTADNITYSMYTGASVDGNGIPADGSSVAQGSLILTLKGSYLDTLSTGTHKVTISFKDGSADATISIVNAPPAPTAAPTHVPKTGDGANLVLWIGLILLGFLGIIAFAGMAGRKHRNR